MPNHQLLFIMPRSALNCLDQEEMCQEMTHLLVLFIAIACLQTRRYAVAAQLPSPGSLVA